MIRVAVMILALSLVAGGQPATTNEDGEPSTKPLIAGVDGVTNPERVSFTEPLWPSHLRARQLEAAVYFQAVIRKDGNVDDIKLMNCVVKRNGKKASEDLQKHCKDFQASAQKAVSKWTYRPATKDGIEVDVYYTISVSFKRDRKGKDA